MSHSCELPRLGPEAEKKEICSTQSEFYRSIYKSPQKKCKVTIFCIEKRVFSKKVCYKVSLCDNFQQQRCNAFTGLSTRAQMVGGNFQLIFARSTSTIAPTKKVQLSLIGSPLRAFNGLRLTVYVAPKPTEQGPKNAVTCFSYKSGFIMQFSVTVNVWRRVLSDPRHHPPATQN